MRKDTKWERLGLLFFLCLLSPWGLLPWFGHRLVKSCMAGMIKYSKMDSSALGARVLDGMDNSTVHYARVAEETSRIKMSESAMARNSCEGRCSVVGDMAHGFAAIQDLFQSMETPIFVLKSDSMVDDIKSNKGVSTVESQPSGSIYNITSASESVAVTVTLSDDGRYVVRWKGDVILMCFPGDSFIPLFITDNDKYLYAISNYKTNFDSLLRLDEHGAMEIIDSGCLRGQDIGGIVTYGDTGRELAALFSLGDSIEYHFISPELSLMHEQASKLFLGADILWINGDAEGRRWLCKVLRRDRPESWYLFDAGTISAQSLFDAKKTLNCRKAELVQYRTRDGKSASGYLTTPDYSGPHPMVVFVHGGPSLRAYPWFDARVQALVQRGYAVFQPNYRGSRGFGKQWQQGGWKEWGIGAAQNDISDGVNYLIESGIADPERIAIFGGSFGGYVALAGLAFTPELYKCGVSFFGISDLESYVSSNDDPLASFDIPIYGNISDSIDRQRLIQQSPLHASPGITMPVLIYHGAKDSLVDVRQSDAMTIRIRKSDGVVEYLRHPEAEHGFIDTTHEAIVFFEMLNFLDKHLLNRQPQTAPDEAMRVTERMRGEGERVIQ